MTTNNDTNKYQQNGGYIDFDQTKLHFCFLTQWLFDISA